MWTFKLREGVKWQDGEPFTADDVVFTFQTIIEDEVANYVGYTEFIETVKAIDPSDGGVHLQQAQDEHARDADPHPARAHLEQADAPRRSPTRSPTIRR